MAINPEASSSKALKPEVKEIQLFKNPVLEALTHIHPIAPLLIWSPIWVGLLLWGLGRSSVGALVLIGFAAFGLISWTLLEYGLHRFGFHFRAKSRFARRLVYLFHGNHHDEPNCATRLVMPPAVSLVLGGVVYLIILKLVPPGPSEFYFAGMVLGYLIYDYIHFSVHHFDWENKWFKRLKRNHFLHHYHCSGSKWGVSSPLWDIVFGTYESRKERGRS